MSAEQNQSAPVPALQQPPQVSSISPLTPQALPTSRRKVQKRTVVIVVIAVIVVIMLLIVGVWVFTVSAQGTRCALGKPIYTGSYWGPDMLVNRPYLGNTTGTLSPNGSFYNFESGSLDLNASVQTWWNNPVGQAWAESNTPTDGTWVQLENVHYNWTVYSVSNTTGPAGGTACTTAFVAAPGSLNRSGGSDVALSRISLANNTTDTGEADCVGIPSCVWFDNNFRGSNYPSVDTCGVDHSVTIAVWRPVHIPIAITFPYQGKNFTASGTLSWSLLGWNSAPLPTMNYVFPANTGTWQIYSPSGTGVPGAFAFQFEPC